MPETLTKATKSQDAERTQDKKRRLEPALAPTKALTGELAPFAGLLGVSAMELPLESHAAFLITDLDETIKQLLIKKGAFDPLVEKSYGKCS